MHSAIPYRGAYVSGAHALQLVTVLMSWYVCLFGWLEYLPTGHCRHLSGLACSLQNDPRGQPEPKAHSPRLGNGVGARVGCGVGNAVGCGVGAGVGNLVGDLVGFRVGNLVGDLVGGG